MVNKAIIIGNLGRDPEVRFTPSGRARATFSVATTERWTDKSGQRQESTEWHRVVLFGKTAEVAQKYLTKGRQVFIEGRIQELEEIIGAAEIIDPSTLSGDYVKFGAHVSVVDEETEKEATYQIVGVHEADIKALGQFARAGMPTGPKPQVDLADRPNRACYHAPIT